MPIPTKDDAIRRLQQQLDEIPALIQLRHGSSKFTEWKRNTRGAIAYTFGEESHQVNEFEDTKYSPSVIVTNRNRGPENDIQEAYIGGLNSAAAKLRSMITEIKEYWEEELEESRPSKSTESLQPINTKRVFLIHGRDHGIRDTLVRFLEQLQLEPVILAEQPNRGQTIIEKFEEHVRVDFAVALLTPDDVGGLSDSELQPRARQNVIFEFGYCIGKFGRGRVVALLKGDPEIPSDYSGVLYITLDEGEGWRLKLAQEMKSAGLNVDLNLLHE